MKLRIETYLRGRNAEGKMETWLSMGRACVTETSYKSVEELRQTIRNRFGGHSTIEHIPNGLKITPNPGTSGGEAYQIITLEE